MKITLLILAAFLFGCNTQLIKPDDSLPVKSSSLIETRGIMVFSLATFGWKHYDKGEGHLIATKHHVSHGSHANLVSGGTSYISIKRMAQIDIFYDSNSYRIKYRDSKNLGHKGNKIHKLYNKWIDELNASIAVSNKGSS